MDANCWKIIGTMGAVILAMAGYIVKQQVEINGILREWLKATLEQVHLLELVGTANRPPKGG
jgi:hypothetical protein